VLRHTGQCTPGRSTLQAVSALQLLDIIRVALVCAGCMHRVHLRL
jgi:hypothetical protein